LCNTFKSPKEFFLQRGENKEGEMTKCAVNGNCEGECRRRHFTYKNEADKSGKKIPVFCPALYVVEEKREEEDL